MASSTTNYNLIKPDYEDNADIKDLNDNFDTIDMAMNNKVDKEIGKGLSTNDYTTAEKTKLDNLAEIKTVGTGLNLDDNGELTATGGGSGGTTNYNDLSNKPQINGNTLSGNKTSAQLGLASASDIPTTLADLSGDSTHRTVSDTEKAAWNNKSDFSGSYNDLTNKPTIPDELSDLTEDATHRTVTDTEKSTWNGKQDALTTSQLAAVNSGINSAKVAQIATNASDISDIQAQADWNTDNGVKNLLDFETWKSLPITRGTSVISGNSITLTATGDNCCTPHTVEGGFPENAKIYVKPNTTYKFTWDCDATASKNGQVYIFPNDTDFVYSFASSKVLSFTTTANTTYLTFRIGVANAGDSITYSNLMIRPALISDTTYQPYAMSNAELTAVKQNALSSAQLDAVNSGIDSTKVEQIETNKNNILLLQSQANWNTNNGVKNICPYNSGSTSAGEGTVWNNLPIDIAAGTYSVSFSTDSMNSALVLLAADGATELLRKRYSTTTVNDTFTISTAAKYIRLYIGVPKTVSNFMIHSFGDDTFVPYALSNAELTAAIQALQAQLANQ